MNGGPQTRRRGARALDVGPPRVFKPRVRRAANLDLRPDALDLRWHLLRHLAHPLRPRPHWHAADRALPVHAAQHRAEPQLQFTLRHRPYRDGPPHAKLTYLALWGNQISGTVPTEMGRLTLLTYLIPQQQSAQRHRPYRDWQPHAAQHAVSSKTISSAARSGSNLIHPSHPTYCCFLTTTQCLAAFSASYCGGTADTNVQLPGADPPSELLPTSASTARHVHRRRRRRRRLTPPTTALRVTPWTPTSSSCALRWSSW